MFPYSLWCSLPISKRHEIAQRFNIPKVGSTEVASNVIKHDGYSVHDIDAALTLENVQRELNTEETAMPVLWDLLVNGKPEPVVVVEEPAPVAEVPAPIVEEKKEKIDFIKTPTKKGKK